jgi:hypothetical protein
MDPSAFNGADGSDGADGGITLTVNEAVSGDINLTAGNGDINVTINDGGTVGGTITVVSSNAATLTFNLSTSSQADYDAALAAIVAANAAGGTFNFGGQAYTWANFNDLVNQVTLLVSRGANQNQKEDNVPLNALVDQPPVLIYSNNNVLILRDPETGKQLFDYSLIDLPLPGDQSKWLATHYIPRNGVLVYANLYLLPNGDLQLIIGGESPFIFTWAPS